MQRHLKKKQHELLHDALGFKSAESEAVKDSFQEAKDSTAYG